ncbi:MAG: DUF1796 family putative cysteine peptidase [Burkholderiaceae bacterium]
MNAPLFKRIVSVGGNCQPAHQIKRIARGAEAQLFDWLLIGAENAARLIENDFAGFLDPAGLTLHSGSPGYVLDAAYDVKLLHDFPLRADFLQHAAPTLSKYAFLAGRWRALMAEPETVLFVWLGPEGREAIERLAAALRARRGGRPFTLLALRSDAQEPDWQLPEVRNRFLRQPEPYVWTGDDRAWDALFGEFGIKPTPDFRPANRLVIGPGFGR